METREYRTIDKSSWDRGPWDKEPDKKQWQDESTSLPCLAVRHDRYGHWCGYVGVHVGHPIYGVAYGQESAALQEALERRKAEPIGDNPGFGVILAALSGEIKPTPELALNVHGGITFSDSCRDTSEESAGVCHIPGAGEPDSVWWFGFDCAHCHDVSPGMDALMSGINGSLGISSRIDRHYRDLEYVEAECASLAQQLAMLDTQPKVSRMIIIEN
jgi:hypothetical protein